MLPPWALKNIQYFLLRSPSTWRAFSWASKENLQAAKEILVERSLQEFRLNKYSVAAIKTIRYLAHALVRASCKDDELAIGCFLQCLQCPSQHAWTYLGALSEITSTGDERVIDALMRYIDHLTGNVNVPQRKKLRWRAFRLLAKLVIDTNTMAIPYMKQVLYDLEPTYRPKEILLCLNRLEKLRQLPEDIFFAARDYSSSGAIYGYLVLSHAPHYHDDALLNGLLYALCRVHDDELLLPGYEALVRIADIDKRRTVRFLLSDLHECTELKTMALLRLGQKGEPCTTAPCLAIMTTFGNRPGFAKKLALVSQLMNTGDARAIHFVLGQVRSGCALGAWTMLGTLLHPCDQELLPMMKRVASLPFYWKQVLRAVKEATQGGIVQGIRLDLSVDQDTSDGSTSQTSDSEITIEY